MKIETIEKLENVAVQLNKYPEAMQHINKLAQNRVPGQIVCEILSDKYECNQNNLKYFINDDPDQLVRFLLQLAIKMDELRIKKGE